tara:strand:+ start:818 stop:1129 length:312 start_codon:yes stop_codon:yes gene_type:complete
LRPAPSFILADPDLIAKRLAAVTVAHEKTPVAETEQMRRQSPSPDGMRLRPPFPSIEGLALQGLTSIIRIVVANLNDQPVPSLYRMKFVIVPVIISLSGWNIR